MPERFANLEEIPIEADAPHDSVITLRLPRAVHAELLAEAENLDMTLNSFVLSKVVADIWPCRLLDDGKNPKRRKCVTTNSR